MLHAASYHLKKQGTLTLLIHNILHASVSTSQWNVRNMGGYRVDKLYLLIVTFSPTVFAHDWPVETEDSQKKFFLLKVSNNWKVICSQTVAWHAAVLETLNLFLSTGLFYVLKSGIFYLACVRDIAQNLYCYHVQVEQLRF